ncbi:MAG: cytochrome c [Pseudomonadota bacterium]
MIAVGAPASWVTAHVGATGIVKERMDVMKGMAEAMKVMGAMVKGEAPFEPAVIADKAGYLAEHANRIPEMTPEGSNDHPSEALPAIWQSWDDYVADADELAIEGAKLVEIATNGADEAAMKAQYLKVGKTCGTCHDRFRKPKG